MSCIYAIIIHTRFILQILELQGLKKLYGNMIKGIAYFSVNNNVSCHLLIHLNITNQSDEPKHH